MNYTTQSPKSYALERSVQNLAHACPQQKKNWYLWVCLRRFLTMKYQWIILLDK